MAHSFISSECASHITKTNINAYSDAKSAVRFLDFKVMAAVAQIDVIAAASTNGT